MPQAASLPKRFNAEDTPANEVDASVKSDKGRSAIAKHLIKVPIFSYLPPRSITKFADNCYLNFGVVGDLDRALTINANRFSAEELFEAVEPLRASASLLCIKGFNFRNDLIGFRRLPGFPRELLKLTPDYWRSQSGKRRSDLLRQRKSVVEIDRRIVNGFPTELQGEILSLYRQTRAKANLKLIEHDLNYFRQTSSSSSYLLYFKDQRLIAFHQMVAIDRTLYSQYVGMDYGVSKALRLYFNLLLDCNEMRKALQRQKTEMEQMGAEDILSSKMKEPSKVKKPKVKRITKKEKAEIEKMTAEDIMSNEMRKALQRQKTEMEQMGAEDILSSKMKQPSKVKKMVKNIEKKIKEQKIKEEKPKRITKKDKALS